MINEAKFSNFTKESCYWAGYLAADGCVKYNHQTLSAISVKSNDKDIIQNLALYMEATNKIGFYNNKYYQLQVFSPTTVLNLQRLWNISPRKSLSYTYPTQMPDEYFYPYLRGYNDGDGSFYLRWSSPSDRIMRFTWTLLSGSASWVQTIKHKLNDIGGKIRHNSGVYMFDIGLRDAKKYLPLMYKDSTERTRLFRKYELYRNTIEIDNRPRR